MTKKISFEDRMVRLEEIVDQIQSSKVKLDESIHLFEEGITLIRSLEDELGKAEEKVKILVTEDGNIREENYSDGE